MTKSAPSGVSAHELPLAELRDAAARRLPDALTDLTTLCAQPSISATGEGMPACARLVARVLEDRRFETEICQTPGHPIVVGRARGRNHKRRLLFYCHYDVQPPDPLDEWHSPPFVPTLRDQCLFARGAADDKGELISRLLGLDALTDLHGDYPCELLFLVEGEEETGSPNLAGWVDSNWERVECDGAVWESGSTDAAGHPTLSLGYRGTLFVELAVRTLSRDAHSGLANVLPNAGWRMIEALASLRSPDGTVRIPGFYDDVRRASRKALALMNDLDDSTVRVRSEFGVFEPALPTTDDASLHLAFFKPTCNVDGFTVGYQGPGMKTVIPAAASAKLDFRLVPDQDPTRVLRQLEQHLESSGFTDLDVRVFESDPPASTNLEADLVRWWGETAEAVYDRRPRIVPLSPGTTPIHLFTSRGIPVVSVGSLYGGGTPNRAHAPNEHVRLADLETAAVHTAALTLRFAHGG